MMLPSFTLVASAAAQKEFTLSTSANVAKTVQTADDYYYIKSVWTVDDNVASITSDSNIKDTNYNLQYMDTAAMIAAATPVFYNGWNKVSSGDTGVYLYLHPDIIEKQGAQATAGVKIAASEEVKGVYGKLSNFIGSQRSHAATGRWYVSDSTGTSTSSNLLGSMKLGHNVTGAGTVGTVLWGYDTILAEHSIRTATAKVSSYGTSLPAIGKNKTIKVSANATTNYGTDVGAFATPGKVTRAEVLVNNAASEGVSVNGDGNVVTININDNIYNSIGTATEATVKIRLYVTMPGKTEGVWTSYTDPITLTRPTIYTSTALSKLSLSKNTDTNYLRTQASYKLSVTDSLYKLPSNIEVKVNSAALAPSQYSYNSSTGDITIPAEYVTGDIYITAIAVSPYTITYNANGGTGAMTSDTVKNGSSYTLKANGFTRNGFVFKGWATAAGGSVVYADKATVTPTKNLNLYAVWECSGHIDADWNGICDKCNEKITTEIVLDSTSVTVNNYVGGVLILASYSGDESENPLIDCKIITEGVVSNTTISISDTGLNTSGASKLKAFLWKDVTSIKPLCEAKGVTIE